MGETLSMHKLINDNESMKNLKRDSSMINVNDKPKLHKKLCSDKEAESGASYYIRQLNAPECREFFIKVMYYLSYDKRDRLLDMALRTNVKCPKRYFTKSAKAELSKIGL